MNDIKSLHKKGLELQNIGKQEEAIGYFDRAIKLQPSNADLLYDKAISLQKLFRFEDAITFYDKSLEIEPSFAALINKGLCLSNPSINRQHEAVICFEEAIRIEPNDLGAQTLKAYSLDNMGRYSEAIHCYDMVLENAPNDLNVLVNKGLSLLHLGRYDEAIAYFDKVLEDEPHNLFAQEWKRDAIKMRDKHLLF